MVWGPSNASLSHDRSDVLGWGDVKCRIFYADPFRRNQFAGNVRDLSAISLLDGNLAAVRSCEIDGRNRGRDIKGNTVFFRQNGHSIRTDLIGNVSVGSDAVSTHDHRADFSLPHDRA